MKRARWKNNNRLLQKSQRRKNIELLPS